MATLIDMLTQQLGQDMVHGLSRHRGGPATVPPLASERDGNFVRILGTDHAMISAARNDGPVPGSSDSNRRTPGVGANNRRCSLWGTFEIPRGGGISGGGGRAPGGGHGVCQGDSRSPFR